jgi:chorismate dehydratase
MKKLRVSAVSYLNTAPFIYGLKHSAVARYIDLSLDTPAVCAARLSEKNADIGLVPVAVIPNLPNYQIISDYCIGAVGKVHTVVLCANSPIETVNRVYMDSESLTSAVLSQILIHKYWKINPEIEQIKNRSEINHTKSGMAYVLIGDKVFDYESKFSYIYDLAAIWRQYRNLPFVFAVWTAVNKLTADFIQDFNDALNLGVNNIPQAIEERQNLPTDKQTATTYLSSNIDYKFDSEKKKALIEFWNLALDEVKSKVRS